MKVNRVLRPFLTVFEHLRQKSKPNERLDSPTIGPSTNDPSLATSFSEIGKSHDLHSNENCQTTVPYQMTCKTKKKKHFNLNG